MLNLRLIFANIVLCESITLFSNQNAMSKLKHDYNKKAFLNMFARAQVHVAHKQCK